MKYELYTLKDNKIKVFTPPFIGQNDEWAKREIATMVISNPALMVSRFPSDFSLYAVGTWSDATGVDLGSSTKSEPRFVGTVEQIVDELGAVYRNYEKDENKDKLESK